MVLSPIQCVSVQQHQVSLFLSRPLSRSEGYFLFALGLCQSRDVAGSAVALATAVGTRKLAVEKGTGSARISSYSSSKKVNSSSLEEKDDASKAGVISASVAASPTRVR